LFVDGKLWMEVITETVSTAVPKWTSTLLPIVIFFTPTSTGRQADLPPLPPPQDCPKC